MRCAVLGSPVSHSLSPVLHRAAYAALGLDWQYDAIECAPADLAELLAGLGPQWRGLSLTMPLKEAVLPLLDVVDPVARRTQAANTLIIEEGRRHGYNTDVAGLVGALRHAGVARVGDAAVVGSGATARSAAAALAQLGCTRMTVVARRPDVGREVLAVAGVAGAVLPWEERARAFAEPLVVSTVPAAAFTASEQVGAGLLFDVLYDPWPTPLAAAWSRAGSPVLGGLELLLHQAFDQVELMTGRPAPRAEMRQAGLAALRQR